MNFFKYVIKFLKLRLNYLTSVWDKGGVLLPDRANIGSRPRFTHPPFGGITTPTLVGEGRYVLGLARVAGQPALYFGVNLFGWKCLGIDDALEDAAFEKGYQRC